MDNQSSVSILWPSETIKERYADSIQVSERAKVDLGIERMVQSISYKQKYYDGIERILLTLCDDAEVIQYRHHILEDFTTLPELRAEFETILALIQKLESQNHAKYMTGAEPLRKIAWQLEILSMYIECVTQLHAALSKFKHELKSEGLHRLLRFVEGLVEGDDYKSMVAELPEFRAKLQSMSSVTLGINLDPELRPVEAIILSVEPKPFKEKKRSLVSSILGLKSVDEEYQGISQFQSILKNGNSPLENALFQYLEEIFAAAILPIGAAIGRYINVNVHAITDLELGIAFYIGASQFIQKLSSVGLAMCKPEVAPKEDRICRVDDLIDFILSVNLNRQHPEIYLGNSVIPNHVEFGPEGRVFILTGPNQGGKTTYTRAIGAAQILFQAGLYVPGSRACMSPVDWIFTHFSEEEKPNINNGRLGEESKRLSEIFTKATPYSLILLNESLSSTSPGDSLYLARDLIKGIKVIGCRSVFATHLLELAANVEAINQELPGDSKLISMVAGVEQESGGSSRPPAMTKRTYKVIAGPPRGMSFAKDIAQLYGISFEQIVDTLKKRSLNEVSS